MSTVAAGSEPAKGLGLERGIAHQPRDPVPTNLVVSSPQLLVDSRRAVETTVPFKHCLHLGREDPVLMGPTARVLLSLPPDIEAAAGHTQLPAQPGHRKAIRQLADQAKPLGGSCSFAK
jgi:hypothetical protein